MRALTRKTTAALASREDFEPVFARRREVGYLRRSDQGYIRSGSFVDGEAPVPS